MSVSVEQLSRLIPIRGLPDPVVRYIGSQATTACIEPGVDLTRRCGSHSRAYLLQGEVRIAFDNGASRVLNASSTAAHSPLPLPDRAGVTGISSHSKSELLFLPVELVESIYDSWWNPRLKNSSGIELKENDLEDHIYMAFRERIQSGDIELPSMPDMAIKISRAVDNPDSNSDDLARIIAADPALAARLIHTANSPAFGGENAISHCRDAITRMGYGNTRNLVTSFVLKNVFTSENRLIQHRMKRLWNHSRHVAAITFALSGLTPDLIRDQAMLTGLIHDIGAIPVLLVATEYPEIINDEVKLDELVAALKSEVGALILRHWQFPQSYIDCALHCNDWFRNGNQKPDYTDLVIVAQLLSHIGSPRMNEMPAPDLLPAFHRITGGQTDPRQIMSILEEARQEIQEVEKLLEGH